MRKHVCKIALNRENRERKNRQGKKVCATIRVQYIRGKGQERIVYSMTGPDNGQC